MIVASGLAQARKSGHSTLFFRLDTAVNAAGHSKDDAHDDRTLAKLNRQVGLVDEAQDEFYGEKAVTHRHAAGDSVHDRISDHHMFLPPE